MNKIYTKNVLFFTIIFSVYFGNLSAQTPIYHKFEVSTGGTLQTVNPTSFLTPQGLDFSSAIPKNILPVTLKPIGLVPIDFQYTAASQSSVSLTYSASGGTNYEALVRDFSDNNFTTGARTQGSTTSNNVEWIKIDLGVTTTFSNIQLGAIVVANLNGAALQTSNDNITWTTATSSTTNALLSSITGSSISALVNYPIVEVSARYVRVMKATGELDLSEFRITPKVSQSSGTVLGTYANLTDNVVTAAATTLGTLADEWVMLDFGANKTFSHIQLATASAAALNGAELQVSTNGTSWTSISSVTNAATGVSGATIADASTVYPITYTFASQTARYVRVRKANAVVNVSEFRVGSAVSQSSATTLAFNGTVTTMGDGTYTNGVTTTATAGVTQWVMLNLGESKTFSHVQLTTITAVGNLNGCNIETSADGVTWTSQLTNISGASTTQLVDYVFPAAVTAQYVRVVRATTGVAIMLSEFRVSDDISLSTGTVLGTVANLHDNSISTGATSSAVGSNQYLMYDLGSSKTFSNVQVAALTAVANLDGCNLQTSADGITWSTLTITNTATGVSGTTFAASSIVYPITYSFASTTARYIRIFRNSNAIVSISEFRVSPGVSQSSATTLPMNSIPTQLNDASVSTGTTTLSTAGVTQFLQLNFQTPKTFSSVQLMALTAVGNLNGADLQYSSDGVTWTNILTSITGSSITTLVNYTFTPVTAQYVRLKKAPGSLLAVSEFQVGTTVSQSTFSTAALTGTPANLTDNSFGTGARTLATAGSQWIMVDLGSSQTVSEVQLAAITAANLNGAALQISTDNVTWTTVNASLTGSSITALVSYTFAAAPARYVRVMKTSAVVDVSEFRINPAVSQSSVSTYIGTVANLQDNTFNTGARTAATGTQWIKINLGSAKTISNVQLSAITAANLNGAALQTSTDNITWTTQIASITGASATSLINYSFSPVSAQYVRVTKTAATVDVSEFRIVDGTATGTTIIAAATTSGVSTLQNIGFNFDFDGVTYTQFSAQVDGMMRLGSTVISSETTNNTLSTTNKPKLFPYWDDLSAGTAATSGGVSYSLTGTTPNRILVVDWNNFNSTATGATNVNFQVWLYETTNKIEYRYGAGIPAAAPSASIGLAGTGQTFGPTTAITQFMSVSPNVTPANSTVSYMKNNDAVTIWPGNGTIYSFTPTVLTSIVAVPTDGNGATEDFPSLDNAMGAVNWKGTPTGGYTVNVQGGYTETVPAGISTTVKFPGLLLTATGTAAKPIAIQWTGAGAKPILTANAGLGNNDYIMGLAGSDYTTIDGFIMKENTANFITPTNAKWTEIGVGLFKKQVGTSSVGANGCQNNIIKNCGIILDRRSNATLAATAYYRQDLQMYTKGIAMVHWDPVTAGASINNGWIVYQPNTTGIVTASDVHSYNEIYSNTIDSCYHGIWGNDRFKANTIVATGNIIGKIGQGNTITNFGAHLGTTYTGGTITWTTHSITVPKGIFLGGFYDANIKGNTINNGYANQHRVFGIEFGTWEQGIAPPKKIGKIDISNNTISNLYGNGAAPATTTSDAYGIIFAPANAWNKKQTADDSVNIKNNIIKGLYTTLGKAIGITSGPIYSDAAYGNTYYSNVDGSNRVATITGNTIDTITGAGSGTGVVGMVNGIYWGQNYSKTNISNNNIYALTLGSASTNPGSTSYLSGITFHTHNTAAARTHLDVNDNNIHENFGKTAGGVSTRMVARMLHIESGGAITNILRDTIQNNDITYATDGGYLAGTGTSMMEVLALPSSGTGTLNIKNNRILSNYRRGVSGGAYGRLNGILVANKTKRQNQFITNNTIDTLEMYGTAAASSTNTILSGIRVYGTATLISTVVDSNIVTALKGNKLKVSGTIASLNNPSDQTAWSMRGIYVKDVKRADVRKNLVYNNTADASTGTSATTANGNCGIVIVGGTAANIYTASNNFIYDLYAPNLSDPLAINGISIHKQGKFFIDHNTVVIGNPLTPTPVTSTGATFGVSGILYAPSANSASRPRAEVDQYTFRNNTIAVQTTNKGTGASMAFRQALVSAAKATPGDVTTKTNGNVYYINTGTWNYLYGQGTIGNTSGGIRNCFAIGGSTVNATHNLVNNIDFNQPCSKYEKFMKGAEVITYTDVNGGGTASIAQPFVGGSANPGKYYITTGSTSYVHNPPKATFTVAIADDYATNNVRPSFSATSGAHETTGTQGPPKTTLLIDYDPIDNTICTTNPTLVASITKVVSSVSVGTGAWAPRLYYKTTINSNLVPSAAQNINTYNGWKYVTPTSISGDDYTFVMDLTKLQPSSWTAPETIEYFVIAADDASLGGNRYITINGTAFDSCIVNVDLYASGGNSNTLHVPIIDAGPSPITVSNSFDIIVGTSITKTSYVNVNNTVYAADNATAISVCPGDSVKITGQYRYLSEVFSHDSFVFETATNAAFSTGLTSTNIGDTTYTFAMGAHPTDIYARMRMTCGGTPVASTNIPYVRLSTLGCPTVTSAQADLVLCTNDSVNITMTNTNTGTSAIRTYFLKNPKGRAVISTGTATSTSATVAAPATDTALMGIWTATVGLTKSTLTNGGFLQATLAADVDNQASGLQEQSGMTFTTSDFVKINSVKLFDDVADAEITTGFKVALYEASSQYKLFETGTLATTDGGTLTVTFTNWYVGPGTYNMVIESFDEGTPMSGLLLSPNSSELPNQVGADMKLLGGISGNDTSTLSDEYNYFLDWNVTTFCTATADSFNVSQGTSNLFACDPYVWLKADANVTSLGTTVSQWTDNSGRGNNATQAIAGSRPNGDTTAVNLVNFHPNIDHDGSADHLSEVPAAFASSTSARTYFVVADPTAATLKPLLSHGTTTNYVELTLGDANMGVGLTSAITASSAYTNSLSMAPKLGTWSLATNGQFQNWTMSLNALPLTHASVDATTVDVATTVNYIGRGAAGTTYFDNKICEVIHYPYVLSDDARNIVQSYLALKWGITLDQSAAPTDYTNSDTVVIWNATTGDNPTYKNRIAGIGRDSFSTLYQKQSQSQEDVSTNTVLTMGVGTIASRNANNAGILTNKTFLIWGDDSASIAEQTTEIPNAINSDPDCGAGKRIAREWKVQKTGTIPALQLQFNLTNTGINGRPASRFKLALNSSSDFMAATTFFNATSFTNGILTFDNVIFTDTNTYITIITDTIVNAGPGGVVAGLTSWYKTDNKTIGAIAPTSGTLVDENGAFNLTRNASGTATITAGSATNFNFNNSLVLASSAALTRANLTENDVYRNTEGSAYSVGFIPQSSLVSQISTGSNGSGVSATAVFNQTTSAYGASTATIPNIFGMISSTSSNVTSYTNGLAGTASAAPVARPVGVYSLNLGSNAATAPVYNNSSIGEAFSYSRTLTSGERNRIESYLAIKYGITLNQTSPQNYVASDSSLIIWDATANAGYNSNIAGIGRDDCGLLNQKQSRSSNTAASGNLVAMGLGTIATDNTLNTNMFAANKDFIVWGDDNTTGIVTTDFPAELISPCQSVSRLSKEWKVQTTGADNAVQVRFYLNGIVPVSTTKEELRLLIDNDNDFANGGTRIITPASYDATTQIADFTGVTFANGEFFTLVTDMYSQAPGNVTANLKLWLRADKGVTTATGVSNWVDQSSTAWTASNATGSTQPTYNLASNLLNFNPTISFDGIDDRLTNTANLGTAIASNAVEAFSVGNLVGTNTAADGIFSMTAGTSLDNVAASGVPFYRNASENMTSLRVATALGSTTGLTANNAYITESGFNGANQYIQNVNGKNLATTSYTNAAFNVTRYGLGCRLIGASGVPSNFGASRIGEILLYDAYTSVIDKQKIRSYLALKYGQTLDQTSAYDYLSSTGSVIWNATTHASYKTRVFGIGVDLCSGLIQKQSRSEDTVGKSILTISLDSMASSNANNSGSFAGDTTFIVLGDNGGALTEQSTDIPSTVSSCTKRLAREWKADVTGTSLTAEYRFDLSSLAITGTLLGEFKMLVDEDGDGDFTTGSVTKIDAHSFVSNILTFRNVALPDGAVFTITTAAGEAAVELTATSIAVKAVASCEFNGWTYFVDPTNVTKYIFALHKNGNTVNVDSIIINTGDGFTDADLSKGRKTPDERAVSIMKRLIQVNAPGTFTVNGGVKVRLYYAQSEVDDVTTRMNQLKTDSSIVGATIAFQWFKTKKTIPQIISTMTAFGVDPGTPDSTRVSWSLAGDSSGVENGIKFIQLHGIKTFSTFGGGVTVANSTPLPVELLDFKGVKREDASYLSWQTASEKNVDRFEIERTTQPSSNNWEKLGEVKAVGNSQFIQDYSFVDIYPEKAMNYYRLKSVDNDASVQFSKTIALDFRKLGLMDISIFPNPVNESFFIYSKGHDKEKLSLKMYDALGRVVWTESFIVNGTYDKREFTRPAHATSGVYMLKLVNESTNDENSVQLILK